MCHPQTHLTFKSFAQLAEVKSCPCIVDQDLRRRLDTEQSAKDEALKRVQKAEKELEEERRSVQAQLDACKAAVSPVPPASQKPQDHSPCKCCRASQACLFTAAVVQREEHGQARDTRGRSGLAPLC